MVFSLPPVSARLCGADLMFYLTYQCRHHPLLDIQSVLHLFHAAKFYPPEGWVGWGGLSSG